MRYGYFDDEAREYVIDRADTPRPWSNYLGTTEYGALITNHAGGYSFYRSAARGRYVRLRFNSIPLDQPGRYLYLRDDDNGDYWSASWQPVGKPLDQCRYECRHGTAYTKISYEYAGIATEATYFVPLGASYECWRLRVRNQSDRVRKVSVFSFVELATDWNAYVDLIDLQFSQYISKAVVDGSTIDVSYMRNVGGPEPQRHCFAMLLGAEVAGFDTRRDEFIGKYRDYGNPAVVERGQSNNTICHGDNPCASFHAPLELAPGETRELLVIMGVGRAETWGKAARESLSTPERVEEELTKLRQHWHDKLGSFAIKSPDADFDSMTNVWGAYNALMTYAWSRAASLVYQGERDGLGYRDTVQDLLGAMALIPEEAGKRLELMLSGQVSTGGAIPVIKPFEHNPGNEKLPPHYRSDDCMWLFNAVPEYVKETGDLAFYDKVIPYADTGSATVLGHLRRAMEFNLERTGAHGLPAGLAADWNDCLNLGDKGESVFVTLQLRYALATYIEVTTMLDRASECAWAKGELAKLDAKISEHCWDGEWFARGYRADGTKLGSHEREEGQIWIEPQPWAVMSGAATREQGLSAMDAVNRRLQTPYGAMLCNPPFRKDTSVGAAIFNAGQKENAGIFCHPQGWVVIAEAMLGRGARAYECFRAYMPSAYNENADIRQIEPYVWCQSTHGADSKMFGVSRLPWLSGTAAWSYYAATHYLCGVRPEYDGLTVDPCVPASFKSFAIERTFRGKLLSIKVENSAGVEHGVRELTVNGKVIAGNKIPLDALSERNEVVVTMG
jgi:cellobiose phosphorylase